MRTRFFCGDEITYNDSGTNQFMVGAWVKPHLTLEWKKVILHATIKTENLEDPFICVHCLFSVYTRLGKNEDDRVIFTEGERN